MVYEVPTFSIVGSFTISTKDPAAMSGFYSRGSEASPCCRSRAITAISDCGNGEHFAIATDKGDIYIYRWVFQDDGKTFAPIQTEAIMETGSIFQPSAPASGMAAGVFQGAADTSKPPAVMINPFTGAPLG